MNLLNLTLSAHRRALAQNRMVPAERKDLESYPMRWHDDDGQMVAVFDETRLSAGQEADVREILERMTGSGQKRDSKLLVLAHMEAFGRFGLRQEDVAAALSLSKPTVLKHLRGFAEDGLVDIREEPNPRKGGSPRKRYFWTRNQPEYGDETLHVEGEPADPSETGLTVQNDRNQGKFSSRTDFGTGIIHHGASAHAAQCPDRCLACKWAFEEAILGEMRSAARRAGGTGFSVGLAERIAAREAAAEAIFAKLSTSSSPSPARRMEKWAWNRDFARQTSRMGL